VSANASRILTTERITSRRMTVDHTLRSSCHASHAYKSRRPDKNDLNTRPNEIEKPQVKTNLPKTLPFLHSGHTNTQTSGSVTMKKDSKKSVRRSIQESTYRNSPVPIAAPSLGAYCAAPASPYGFAHRSTHSSGRLRVCVPAVQERKRFWEVCLHLGFLHLIWACV